MHGHQNALALAPDSRHQRRWSRIGRICWARLARPCWLASRYASSARRIASRRRPIDNPKIDAWLANTLRAWRDNEATHQGPVARPLFCGPEVWGRDLEDPPDGYWPPKR